MFRRISTTFTICVLILVIGVHLQASEDQYLPYAEDTNGYEIVINLPAMELHLYCHGLHVKRYPISVGTMVSPSRLGSTHIVNKVYYPTYYPPNWYSLGLEPIPPGPKNPVGTRWLGLGWSGFGIHGTNNASSIGRAMSSGCIRMHNSDIEELFDLVMVGTPVTFVYQSILTGVDPLTGRPYIQVYKDLYNLGTNSWENVIASLDRIGVDISNVRTEVLKDIVNEAKGIKYSLPRPFKFMLGTEVVDDGFYYGNRGLISLQTISMMLKESIAWNYEEGVLIVNNQKVSDGIVVGGKPYAPARSVAQIMGLKLREKNDLEGGKIPCFDVLYAEINGTDEKLRVFLSEEIPMLSVQEFTEAVGLNFGWNLNANTLMWQGRPVFAGLNINGEIYLPYNIFNELMEIDIIWEIGRNMSINLPFLEIDGNEKAENNTYEEIDKQRVFGFWQDEVVYVPIREVADLLNVQVGWDADNSMIYVGKKAVPGLLLYDKVYVTTEDLQHLFPSLQYNLKY